MSEFSKKIFERSIDDNDIIVGSEIRRAIIDLENEMDSLLDTIEQAVRNPTLKAPRAVLINALMYHRPEALK